MKIRLIAFLFLLTFLVEVGGFNIPGGSDNVISIGSELVVSNYCITSGKDLTLYFQQFNANGIRITYHKRDVTGPFPSKEIMDMVVQYEFAQGINELIAHPEYGHDRNRPFNLYASYRFSNDSDVFYECTYPFSLVRSGSTYTPPSNISGAVMVLPKQIPYKLEGVTYAHLETTNHLTGTFRVDDSRIGSTNIQSVRKVGFFRLMIPCAEAIGADGTNVSIKINVRNWTNKFEVYVNGQQVAEKRPVVKISLIRQTSPVPMINSRNAMGPHPLYATPSVPSIRPSFIIGPDQVKVEVIGGEIGRTYRILTATSATGPYTDTGSRHTVTPTSNTTTITLELDVSDQIRLFQVESIDVLPTY